MIPKNSLRISEVKNFLIDLQSQVTAMVLEEEPGNRFREDKWEHNQGGGGITKVLSEGKCFEKVGVNFSHVIGKSLPSAATLNRPHLRDKPFQAMGVSVVSHPFNPYVPTAHMNVRFIFVEQEDGTMDWWFGGGYDLTPYYGFVEDCIRWHAITKSMCDKYGEDVYLKFKQWCDEYFYIKHRHEPRGIGGIFFDDLNEWGFDKCFSFAKDVGEHFIKAYQPIIKQRNQKSFTEKEKSFQHLRRGRYVEFNLLYDRGTLFGLQSQGRTESILVSMPPQVAWQYDWQPMPDSEEARLYETFLKVREWV